MESKARGEHFNASVADFRAAAIRNDGKNLGVNVDRRRFHLSAYPVASGKTNKLWPATSKNT
jgi:hypothetical protein